MSFPELNTGNIVFMYGDSNDANAIMVKDGIERVFDKENINGDI